MNWFGFGGIRNRIDSNLPPRKCTLYREKNRLNYVYIDKLHLGGNSVIMCNSYIIYKV
jgi:hypothetical protein